MRNESDSAELSADEKIGVMANCCMHRRDPRRPLHVDSGRPLPIQQLGSYPQRGNSLKSRQEFWTGGDAHGSISISRRAASLFNMLATQDRNSRQACRHHVGTGKKIADQMSGARTETSLRELS
jgi:hypothetical protein